MLCTFCGTENRPDNKFCGMCGVRLERRQAERRRRQTTASLKCPSCGHVNELGHRFCGLCGTRTDRRSLPDRRALSSEQPWAVAMANAQLPTPDSAGRRPQPQPLRAEPASITEVAPPPAAEIPPHSKPAAAIFRSEPPASTIGGPSFLGLGDEPHAQGEYLLEDEGSSGRVLRRLVLIAILAAIAGLVFVGWRSGSFRANPKSPEPRKTQPAAAPSPQSSNPNPMPEATEAIPSSANSHSNASPDSSPAAAARSEAKEAGKASSPAESEESGIKSPDGGKEKAVSTKVKASEAASSPIAKKPPSATLLKAQQYLQGRGGVRQNCEQGLVYLRAATQQNEPAAAVQMGALYASGHCVQQDRVMAYRWFNSAHELDPANSWIQTNMEQLWARMTPQERRQAGP